MVFNETVLVIAPDRDSGDAFDTELTKAGLQTEVIYPKIAPRVLGDTLNRSGEVERDLAKVFRTALESGHKNIAIACNTLQFYVPSALKLLGEKVPDFTIYTTFDALRKKYPDINNRPIMLATTPTSKEIKDFPVPNTLEIENLQDLVQEAILRIKKIGGSDISTAFENVKNEDLSLDEQVSKVKALGVQIGKKLKETNQDTAVLACTELPILFFRYFNDTERVKFLDIEFVDPASVLAEFLSEFQETLSTKERHRKRGSELN